MDYLELLDWKRQIFDLYARVRNNSDAAAAWEDWKTRRSELYLNHSMSPLPADRRGPEAAPEYFDYDPAFRALATIKPADPEPFAIAGSTGNTFGATRVAHAAFSLGGQDLTLDLFLLEGYGGGIFIPFRDQTSGRESYGGGRYLLDTVKGADLGGTFDELVFDFNFAYNPSCSYDPIWACPLTPPPNQLVVEVRAGEKAPAWQGADPEGFGPRST